MNPLWATKVTILGRLNDHLMRLTLDPTNGELVKVEVEHSGRLRKLLPFSSLTPSLDWGELELIAQDEYREYCEAEWVDARIDEMRGGRDEV